MRRDEVRYKGVCPIPDDMAVLIRIDPTDEDPAEWEDVRTWAEAPFIAIQEQELFDGIVIGSVGYWGDATQNANDNCIVPTRKCPDCGTSMFAHMLDDSETGEDPRDLIMDGKLTLACPCCKRTIKGYASIDWKEVEGKSWA